MLTLFSSVTARFHAATTGSSENTQPSPEKESQTTNHYPMTGEQTNLVNDATSAQYAAYETGEMNEYPSFNNAENIKPVAFEKIAKDVAGTVLKVFNICHAFYHQEDDVSNAQLIEFMLYDTCSHTEQEQFEQIMASPEERALFCADPDVQRILSQQWAYGTTSGQKILTAFPQVQRDIALAIKEGKFVADPDMWRAITNNPGIFTDPQAQRDIAVAIKEGKFVADPNIWHAITSNPGIFIFTDPQAQKDIAWLGQLKKFKTDSEVWQDISNTLGIFTAPGAQIMIAMTIRFEELDTYPNALQAIANNLRVFTHPQAQIMIAEAINERKFGNNPKVLEAIANNLRVFTDPQAQTYIGIAIRFGAFGFGTNPNIWQAIANNLGAFEDSEKSPLQAHIATAIKQGRFGTNPNVLQTIASNLCVFTDPYTQREIAKAINAENFDTDPHVLQTLASNLCVFTDPEAQIMIALAINAGKFGANRNVLQAIANNLRVFTNLEAQIIIAKGIKSKRLSTDIRILKTIAGIPIYSKAIIMLTRGLSLKLAEKIFILNQIKFSLNLPTAVGNIPTENLPNLFGAKAYLGREVIRLLKTKFSTITNLAADAIDPVCYDNQQYALQLNDNQLILYPLTADQAEFRGWITSDNSVFYKQCVTNVTIFDFSNLKNGYPTQIDGKDLSPSHTSFATLPGYLKQAVRDNHFKLEEFRHHGTIKFVTQTLLEPLMQKDRDLATRMQSIMQSSIVNRGDCVAIAATDNESARIKDSINALCQDVANTTDFNAMSKRFFDALPTIDDKARLAVLFGTMAKRGVLGYEYGNKNQANNLLYSLAKACFDNLKWANNIVFPEDPDTREKFHTSLAHGVCIESLTNRFIDANSSRIDFHDVFALSVGV